MSQLLPRIEFAKKYIWQDLSLDEIEKRIKAFDEFECQRRDTVFRLDAKRQENERIRAERKLLEKQNRERATTKKAPKGAIEVGVEIF